MLLKHVYKENAMIGTLQVDLLHTIAELSAGQTLLAYIAVAGVLCYLACRNMR